MTLTGRHALVTGGGTGIGAAIARSLGAQGAQVTITGRRLDVLESAAAQARSDGIAGLCPAVMDVTDPASVTSVIDAATAARGPVSICVANAGIAEGRPVEDTDLAFWRRTMTTNLDGAFLTIHHCLPAMRAAGWGRVIAVSSMAGLKGLRGASAYTVSKHGMVGLIRALSEEIRTGDLTFNALCPGYVDTPIVSRNMEAISARSAKTPAEAREMMARANRHNRLIDPDEVAAAALWLCAPGSGSVNGQAIEIAGGQV